MRIVADFLKLAHRILNHSPKFPGSLDDADHNVHAGNTGGSLFGNTSTNPTTTTTGGGLFGNAAPAGNTAGGGLFGSTTGSNTGGGLFGSTATSTQTAPSGGFFGITTAAPTSKANFTQRKTPSAASAGS